MAWIWHCCGSAATALIRPLAWEPQYTVGVALKKTKDKKNKQKNKYIKRYDDYTWGNTLLNLWSIFTISSLLLNIQLTMFNNIRLEFLDWLVLFPIAWVPSFLLEVHIFSYEIALVLALVSNCIILHIIRTLTLFSLHLLSCKHNLFFLSGKNLWEQLSRARAIFTDLCEACAHIGCQWHGLHRTIWGTSWWLIVFPSFLLFPLFFFISFLLSFFPLYNRISLCMPIYCLPTGDIQDLSFSIAL